MSNYSGSTEIFDTITDDFVDEITGGEYHPVFVVFYEWYSGSILMQQMAFNDTEYE